MGWEKYVGEKGRVLAMTQFGRSAPFKILAEKFGFTPENIIKLAREMRAAK